MRRVLGMFLITAGLWVPICSGQEFLDEVNFRASQLGGIHIVGVSVYSGWSSHALPQSGFSVNTNDGILGADVNYGVNGSLGWQYHRLKTDIAALYSAGYGGMVRYSDLGAFSQNLSLTLSRRLGEKWTFSASATGSDSNMAQYLFQPSSLGVLTQIPSNFDDLAAAFGAGQFTDAQAASMLTGAPIMQSATRTLLLGNRVFTYSGQASLGYSPTERWHFRFSSVTAAGQTRYSGQDSGPANYLMPRSTGLSAGAGFSYGFSPRTDVGVNLDGNRNITHFQSAYSSSASVFLARRMGIRWFLNVHGGGSYSVVTHQASGTPIGSQVIGGGSLGFRAGMHTLVGSYERSSSDPFGFAVGTITTASGAWSWHHPGSRWGLSVSGGQQQTRNTGFVSLSGWQASGGVNTSLNANASMSLQYVYIDSMGAYLGTVNHLTAHSIRVSMGWAPQNVNR